MTDKEKLPFLAVGDDELGGPVPAVIVCPHCGEEHEVTAAGDKITLHFYRCPAKGASYLLGINGRVISKAGAMHPEGEAQDQEPSGAESEASPEAGAQA